MKGFVYILTNPSMPGIVKIGRTSRSVHGRAGELYQTGVPTPFVVEHSVLSPDCVELERDAHNTFAGQRVGPDREFFLVDADQARQCVNYLQREQISALVSEFMPDHVLVEQSTFIDEADVALVCHKAGVSVWDLVRSFDRISPEAVKECVDQDAKRRAAFQVQWPSEAFRGLPN